MHLTQHLHNRFFNKKYSKNKGCWYLYSYVFKVLSFLHPNWFSINCVQRFKVFFSTIDWTVLLQFPYCTSRYYFVLHPTLFSLKSRVTVFIDFLVCFLNALIMKIKKKCPHKLNLKLNNDDLLLKKTNDFSKTLCKFQTKYR